METKKSLRRKGKVQKVLIWSSFRLQVAFLNFWDIFFPKLSPTSSANFIPEKTRQYDGRWQHTCASWKAQRNEDLLKGKISPVSTAYPGLCLLQYVDVCSSLLSSKGRTRWGLYIQGTTLSIVRTIIFVGIFKALWRDPPCQGPRKDMPASLKECWGPWSHIVEEFLKHTSWLLCCDNHLDHNEVDHQTCLKMTYIHWMFHKHKQQREQYSCLKQYMARPQLVKRYGGSSPKIAISQSVPSSCEIGSTLGILTVFLKTGFIFFGQQATNSFQSCSNLFKHKETYVFQSCLYSIQNRDPSSWRRNMASIVSVIAFVPGDVSRCQANLWWRHIADQPMNDDHHSLWGVCLEMMGCCWNSVWWLVSQEL